LSDFVPRVLGGLRVWLWLVGDDKKHTCGKVKVRVVWYFPSSHANFDSDNNLVDTFSLTVSRSFDSVRFAP